MASAFLSVLTTLNVVLGMLVAIAMMSGSFINSFMEGNDQNNFDEFTRVFLSYVLHPATGLIYISLFIGLATFQRSIKSIATRYMLNFGVLLISSVILLYLAHLMVELDQYLSTG